MPQVVRWALVLLTAPGIVSAAVNVTCDRQDAWWVGCLKVHSCRLHATYSDAC
jgi:hypothetical protein